MEKFKQIKDYENYLISNYGNVRSKRFPNRFLKPLKNGRGYILVTLSKNGVKKIHSIHRLVALAFITNPDKKPQVNHIDGCKTNNHADNLEWCSQKENVHHACDTGLQDNKGEKNGQSKLSEKEVLEIRRIFATGEYTKTALGEMFDVSQMLISYIIRRKMWTHI